MFDNLKEELFISVEQELMKRWNVWRKFSKVH
jgi:hypothetical protein